MALSRPRDAALYEGFDYGAFWEDPSRKHLDELERFVVGALLPPSGRRILDAGCGFGRLTEVYADRFDDVFLLDAAWSLLEEARDRWEGRVTLVAADLSAIPFRVGVFDAEVAVRVLHHLADPRAALRGLRRLLAPGGSLVFNISNKRNLKRVARARRHGEGSPFAHGIVPYGRRSFGMHPQDAERLLAENGFRPTAWRGVGVMDKVAARAGPFANVVPSGRMLAHVLGRVRVAPSLFGAAVAGDPVARSAEPPRSAGVGDLEAFDPFRCPACGGAVPEIPAGRRCDRCRRIYPLRDGILDFRL